MERLEKETFYGLRVYDVNGNILDKTDGPGDSGDWQYDPEHCPMEMAIFAIDPSIVNIENDKIDLFDAERIVLDKDYNETGRTEKSVCVIGFDLNEARAFAKTHDLDFFYWLFWEGPRHISIEPVNDEDEVVFYSYNDD